MQKQPSINKITRPTLPKVFPRKRLFRLLDQDRRYPVTWVSGPPGSGKTTFVATYLDARKLPCLWYQVDEGDADIATFFYYLGLAAKKAAPRIKQPLPLFTPEYQFGISAFAKRYFENLYTRLKPPSVIVFDNYQEVPADSPFHEMIQNGLAEIPRNIRVIVISRADPLPVFTRLQANAVIGTIGWEDLRFTTQETSGAMKLHSGKALPKEKLQQIYEKTQGWAAGMVLVEAAWSRGDGPHASGAMLPGKISDYFAEEVFGSLDEEMQQFLLKTSFLPRMTPRMAEEISGIGRAGQILADLNRGNYFTERRAGPEISYQYHALFREFLRSRARRAFSPGEYIRMMADAAALLEAEGFIEDAAEMLMEQQDWERFGVFVLGHAQTLINQGRSRTLGTWLKKIPHDHINSNPWLVYWLGVCDLPIDLAEARRCLEKAFESFKAQAVWEGIYLSWAGVIDTFIYEWGDFTALDRWIAEMEALQFRSRKFPSPQLEMRVAISIFNALLYRQTAHPDLPVWAERLNAYLHRGEDINYLLMIGNQLILYYVWMGELSKAAAVINALRGLPSQPAVSPLVFIQWKAINAMYCWFTADLAESRQCIAESLKAADAFGVHMMDFIVHAQNAYNVLSRGDLDAGAVELQLMQSLLSPHRYLDVSHCHYLAAWHAILRGDISNARTHAESALEKSENAGAPFPNVLNHLTMAQVLFEQGHYKSAYDLLAKAEKVGRPIKSRMLEYKFMMLRSYFALRQEDEKTGCASLRGAMRLGRENGFLNIDWWRPEVMSLLCAKALEHGIEVEYVRDLIRKRNLNPPSPPFAKGGVGGIWMDSWPWPIRINTLGRFEILKDGKPVRFSGKVQKKPLEMLKALIAFGGKEVPGEQIAAALWPHADGDAAYKAFGITLIRLRELLGVKDAVHLSEGNVTLDQRFFWIDTWAFEHMLESSEFRVQRSELNAKRQSASGNRQSEMNLSLLKKALELYKGPFLGAESATWAISLQERLKDKFLRAVLALGASWEREGEFKKAVEEYLQGLAVDDLAEEFYQRLIGCHCKLGQRAEAIRMYRRCEKTLSAILGVAPSPATMAIYRKVQTEKS